VKIVADAFALLSAFGLIQCLIGWAAVSAFAARRVSLSAGADRRYPGVSVLKPLCGDEPLLEEALASCCRQDYPEFEIIFGVQDANDPALAIVRRIRQRFPDCDITVVVDSRLYGSNRKVGNLINMLPSARHDVLVISDSDLHLQPDYLKHLVTELEKPGTGLVTTLYTGHAATECGWVARLGATQISHIFLAGVLVARLGGRQDCLGSTTMMRRETLELTGGLEALVNLLAEDNVLGQRVRDLGLSVGLAATVPAATVPEACIRALWQHEMRWTRTIRELAPVALASSALQYPLFWALMALCSSGGALWALSLFMGGWFIRAAVTLGIDHALRNKVGRPSSPAPLPLLPIRDILSVIEIAASYCIDKVVWRGHTMGASGTVTPVGPIGALMPPETLEPEAL
jgi:ceramide glucosyltransferase